MYLQPGSIVSLDIEKPVTGGRMLARHDTQVVLASGAIPGERVRARVERRGKGVIYAETIEVIEPSADRRAAGEDWQCGGNVFAHIAYERQRHLKGEILRDALGRIGRIPLPAPPAVMGSPEHGYRMRARLHARGNRLGFYREGTHDLCDAAATAQLLPATVEWIATAQRTLERQRLAGITGVEIAENVPGDQRLCHLDLQAGVDTAVFASLADGGALTGLSASRADRREVERLAGAAMISDVLRARGDDPSVTLHLRRGVRSFFQSNRFLLEPLVHHVVGLVLDDPIVDLYAGVGLFGLSLAVGRRARITLVEGDPISGADLVQNAAGFAPDVVVARQSVETFVAAPRVDEHPATVIVDPPRIGMSKAAVDGVCRLRAPRIIYVSCDVATLARDARALVERGYELGGVTGIDLFPNTAHVEAVAVFSRAA
jgi:23S rRNA (uracil1939-C5)-methyltransferase